MSTRQVLIGCVFLAGCVVGGVSSQLVAPPARAQNSTAPRWEHYCFAMDGDAADALTRAGREGWELVSAGLSSTAKHNREMLYCMKRPMP